MKMITLNPPERSRTYHFYDGSTHTFCNVVKFAASGSTHRLVLGTGEHFIIPKETFKFIALDIDEFQL